MPNPTYWLLAVWLVLPWTTARADDREKLLAAFNKLKIDGETKFEAATKTTILGETDVLLPKTFHATIPTVKTPLGDSRMIVKVWAQLDVGEKKKVSLSEYEWSPGEPYFLFVETAVPVRMALYDKGFDKNEKDKVVWNRVLPTGTENDPTWKVIKPGTPFKVEPRLRCKANSTAEEVGAFVFIAEGSVDNPQPPDKSGGSVILAEKDGYFEQLDQTFAGLREKGTTLRGLEAKAIAPKQKSSGNSDEVALVGVSAGSRGYANITFKKKK